MAERKRDRTRLLRGWILVLTIVLAVAAAGATIPFDPAVGVTSRIAMVVFGAAIAILSFLKLLQEDAAKAAIQAEKVGLQNELDAERVRILTVTNSVFQAIAQSVNDMATLSPSRRARDIVAFRQSVIDKALELVKCDAPRASYFRLERRTPRRLVHSNSAYRKRVDETTRVFVEGSGKDQNVWRILDTNGFDRVENLETEAPDDFSHDSQPLYRTYMTVAVVAGGIPFGIFTINALKPGDLSAEDLPSMRVLARLLGAAEGLALTAKQIRSLSRIDSAGL